MGVRRCPAGVAAVRGAGRSRRSYLPSRRPLRGRCDRLCASAGPAGGCARPGGPGPAPPHGGVRGYSDAEADMVASEELTAMCVQRFDDSRNSAIHTTYRISLRSSSLREPRYPLLRVVSDLLRRAGDPQRLLASGDSLCGGGKKVAQSGGRVGVPGSGRPALGPLTRSAGRAGRVPTLPKRSRAAGRRRCRLTEAAAALPQRVWGGPRRCAGG
jgi:hypothetical protein